MTSQQSPTGTGNGPTTDEILLLAPLDGWVSPLSEVPDPVFAGKMMGDGVALDPLEAMLRAPCDGEVMMLHPARHVVTLKTGGAEILMHVGLDTVALAGEGFTAHVRQGQKVKAGDPLLSFDLDRLGARVKSLVIPIVIANGERFAVSWRLEQTGVKQGQVLMRLKPLASTAPSVPGMKEAQKRLAVPLVHGLHARPAARIANLAKSFACEIQIASGEKRANAKSATAIMGLGLGLGADAALFARGSDAEAAVAAIARLIESGMGEGTGQARDESPPASRPVEPSKPGEWTGVRAAPGLALGPAVTFILREAAIEEEGRGPGHETRRLNAALAETKERIQRMAGKGGAQEAILAAHLAFLDDPELIEEAQRSIEAGKSAGFGWRRAIRRQAAILEELDARFAERAADLADLERQVLTALGEMKQDALRLPDNAILLADDLLPSQVAGLDLGRLAGIALGKGGPTSHVAILAQAAGIPMLVACGRSLLAIESGAALFLDADQARLVRAQDATRDAVKAKIAAQGQAREQARMLAQSPGATADGRRIGVHANLGSLPDATLAMASGAEGCGLLRTEFLFLERETPPGEGEQTGVYKAIAEALDGKPLVIRTLDIGGDKPAPYLSFPPEENPALGLRGVRVSLWRPDLLAAQLRAILRAVPARQCRIMAPMVASLDELREVRRMLDLARAELDVGPVPLGVMVETPAAAVTADLLAAEADFLSIGTNDLTQYCLAMDRGNESMAARFDALHPAVLRLIAATAEGAAKHAKPVSVCGGLASEPSAAPILVGLGVTGLSAAPAQIPALKARLASITFDRCARLAGKALSLVSGEEVRALLQGEN